VVGTLCALGIAGNVLSIVVLGRDHTIRRTTGFMLQMLAVVSVYQAVSLFMRGGSVICSVQWRRLVNFGHLTFFGRLEEMADSSHHGLRPFTRSRRYRGFMLQMLAVADAVYLVSTTASRDTTRSTHSDGSDRRHASKMRRAGTIGRIVHGRQASFLSQFSSSSNKKKFSCPRTFPSFTDRPWTQPATVIRVGR